MSKRALEGLRILDLSRVLAGPICTMQFGDLGADVIKVEQPGIGDGTRQWGPPWAGEGSDRQSAYFLGVNRNKRSITVNLKQKQGREIVRQLAVRSDVIIENFKVGEADRMTLGYESLKQDHPGLVYCSITGYGQTGPYRNRPGYDFVIQAQGGTMSITGPEAGPPHKVGVAIVDIVAGLYAASAILAALRHREQSGEGQYIDISLLDTQVAWLANVANNYLVSGETPRRYGNAHPNIVPYNVFETADGYLALGVGTDRQYQRLCDVIGRPDLWEDERFQTNPGRVEHREDLIPILQDVFRARRTTEWVAAIIEAGIPAGPINDIRQVFDDPQVQSRNMITEIQHPVAGNVRLVGSPLKLSVTPVDIRMPPPVLGQHTDEILEEELNYSAEKIIAFHQAGIV